MLYSMTGFGRSCSSSPSTKITVEIKSLNSKQLDLSCRIPYRLRAAEPQIRAAVGAVVERGKVDLTVVAENVVPAAAARLNDEAVQAYVTQIAAIAERTGLPLPADWFSVLLRLPEVMTPIDEHPAAEGPDAETLEALMLAVEQAVNALMDHRRAEGIRLEEFFELRIARIGELLAEVPRYETERTARIKARLTDALSKIPAVDYDKGRLEQEMIYYIEKLDVSEEKQRLAQHLAYFLETMRAPKGGQGKKLGFIAQEMAREINTLGSKSNHAEMQNLVVRMKDELEQIKEQVLNVM